MVSCCNANVSDPLNDTYVGPFYICTFISSLKLANIILQQTQKYWKNYRLCFLDILYLDHLLIRVVDCTDASKNSILSHASSWLRERRPILVDITLSDLFVTSKHMKPLSLEKQLIKNCVEVTRPVILCTWEMTKDNIYMKSNSNVQLIVH